MTSKQTAALANSDIWPLGEKKVSDYAEHFIRNILNARFSLVS